LLFPSKSALKQNWIRFLGTGDGHPCDDRFHSSILLNSGGRLYLFDCGEPCTYSLKKLGVDFNTIDKIFISHLHGDHIGGFQMLMQGMWLMKRKAALAVHIPKEGIEPVKGMLEAGYLFDNLMGFSWKMEPHVTGKKVKIFDGTVTAYPSSHLQMLKRAFGLGDQRPFEAFSFKIEIKGIRIVFSMDLGAPQDLDSSLKNGADVLVCELAHFDLEDIFNYLAGKDIKKIIFTHVGGPFYKDLPRVKRMATRLLKGKTVVFAKDGMQLGI